MAGDGLITVGHAAGGWQSLERLVDGFPPGLPAGLLVVLHLRRAGPLAAPPPGARGVARHGRRFAESGRVPPWGGPRGPRACPALDPLLRRAAPAGWARRRGRRVFGAQWAGGTGGGPRRPVKWPGRVAVLPDPGDTLLLPAPGGASESVEAGPGWPDDPLRTRLAGESLPEGVGEPAPQGAGETTGGPYDPAAGLPGTRPAFACPECGGVLGERDDGRLVRYRCQAGHAFTPEGLAAAQSEAVEGALWAALRGLEEGAALTRHLAGQARRRGRPLAAAGFLSRAREAERWAALLREALLDELPEAPAPRP